ncbi:proton-dependent oligopeptide transporter [Parelusimicrobium proximum]|uniref:peptide MFS transporter n=1 Tax=Parelusimicrobium proximum TaxID=3228953 RepID=UPI003D17A32C
MDAHTAPQAKSGHPKGLYMLFMVEMWERFNYYGMRALLALFMTSTVIGLTKATSSFIYSWFTGLVYLTPVLGGILADKWIGKRHSITIGAILMAAGQFTLASYDLIPARLALSIGLVLIILGNGFFKPNISSIVGELYEENDPRRDGGFTIFYMGINLGAFIAPFICGSLGQKIAWKYGFMAAGIGMLIGLVWYLVSQNKYLGDIGLYPVGKSKTKNDEGAEKKPLTPEEWDKIKAISTFVFFAIFFFAFFEQAGTSLTFFADEATRLYINLPFFGSVKLESSWFQSVNPIFVILLAPIFAKMWIRLSSKGKEPSIPAKFGWGLFLQGFGFAIIALGASIFLKTGPVGAIWLIGVYFFCTCGELCLSPVGLSMVTKLAPAKLMSLLMGVWLMSSFFGNLLAGWLASFYEKWSLTTLFSVPAVLSMAFGIIMWVMTKKVKTWMHGVK